MMNLVLLSIFWMISSVASFCPVSHPAMGHPTKTCALSAIQNHADANGEGSMSHPWNEEISRRAALVIATTTIAGTSASPLAQAASLSAIVSGLETEFIGEVNSKGAREQHIPSVEVNAGSSVKVVVPHVMDAEKPHYIQYIWLKDEKTNKVIAAKSFKATDASPPTLTASVKKASKVKPLLFCNLHGLWQGDSVSV